MGATPVTSQKCPGPPPEYSCFSYRGGLSVIRHYTRGARNVPVLYGTRATLELRQGPSLPQRLRAFNQQKRSVLRALGRHLMPRLPGQSSHGQVARQERCCGLQPGPSRSGRPVSHAWPVRAQALARTFSPQPSSATHLPQPCVQHFRPAENTVRLLPLHKAALVLYVYSQALIEPEGRPPNAHEICSSGTAARPGHPDHVGEAVP